MKKRMQLMQRQQMCIRDSAYSAWTGIRTYLSRIVPALGGNVCRLHRGGSRRDIKHLSRIHIFEQIPALRGCQVHTSVMLSEVDIKIFKKLGVDLTSEDVYKRQVFIPDGSQILRREAKLPLHRWTGSD